MKEKTLANNDIVLYALYLLGGWQKRIHTEDIALKCYKLAGSKFSWVKYPEYPDIAPARFSLEKKAKNGALVIGQSERKRTVDRIGGWMLTAEGVKWIETNRARIEKYLGKHKPIADRVPSGRKLKELFTSQAFREFSDYGEQAVISHAEFAESLVCTVNARSEVLNDRLQQLFSISEELGKKEVKNYVNFCRKRFASILMKRGREENGTK